MPKTTSRKIPAKRKPTRKKSFLERNVILIIGFLVGLIMIGVAYHYRDGVSYYLGFKTHKRILSPEEKRLSDVRNFQLLNKYSDKVIGFDVSQYQETIDWSEVRKVEDSFPLRFVFIRATVGKDVADLQFHKNWFGSKRNNFIRGAYHYYRPNENSIEQADNFIKEVTLEQGDLPPVLDIEKLPEEQSLDSLKLGLKRWLDKVEKHYGVKPIIYTGEKYYTSFLRDEFKDYTFWIANYNLFVEDICDDWQFWQFTESASVKGVPTDVDLNIYNGTPKMLDYLRIN